jgi:hypothetical protein
LPTWGIASVLIGNTFTVGPSPTDAQRAQEAIEQGRAIGAKTQRERDYIEAVAAYYDHLARRISVHFAPLRERTHEFSDSVGRKSRTKTPHFSSFRQIGFVQLDQFWAER